MTTILVSGQQTSNGKAALRERAPLAANTSGRRHHIIMLLRAASARAEYHTQQVWPGHDPGETLWDHPGAFLSRFFLSDFSFFLSCAQMFEVSGPPLFICLVHTAAADQNFVAGAHSKCQWSCNQVVLGRPK